MAESASPSPKPLPSFDELLDRAVLSHTQRIGLILLHHVDPLAASAKLAGMIIGQRIAERVAAEEDVDHG